MRSFFQTKSWGEFKSRSGWIAREVAGRLGMYKPLFGSKGFWYYPELPWEEKILDDLPTLVGTDKGFAIFARAEFLTPYTDEKAKLLLRLGFIKSFEDVQPEYRRWVVIDQKEKDLLAQMKEKGRYNVRLSLRKPLTVTIGTEPRLVERFFQLYRQTSLRSHFSPRNGQYFQDLVKVLEKQGVGEVIIISHNDQDLSGGIFLYYEGVASYLYGGSQGERSFMAPYRLHIEAIRRAKEKGCVLYDLIAVEPPGEINHPYAGITRFKEQFGGETVQLLGSWDYIYRPTWYKIYSLLERWRRRKRR